MILEIILLAAITALIFFHLTKILGKKNDAIEENINQDTSAIKKRREIKDVYFEEISIYENDLTDKIKSNLQKIQEQDPLFNVCDFIDRAKKAFSLIITALDKGDEKTLSLLLGKDILPFFKNESQKRRSPGRVYKNILLSIKEVKILDCFISSGTASIKIAIKSEQINYIEDSNGTVLSGSKKYTLYSNDIWTFSREFKVVGDYWRLQTTA